MARKIDDAEARAVLLRTTSDIVSGALTQLDCLASKWPEYAKDAKDFRVIVERMVVHAKEYGYFEKRGRV